MARSTSARVCAHFLVTQPDSHTIRVDTDGGTFRVPYRFYWDGHEREPESVVLDQGQGRCEVRAFFLFGTIVDMLSCDPCGVTIARSWTVKSIGTVRLSIDLDFDLAGSPALLFPGVSAGELPAPGASFPGDRTSYPLAVLVRRGLVEALVWSDGSAPGGEPASIGAFPLAAEESPSSLRVQVRAPGIGLPFTRVGPRQEDVKEPVEATMQSAGSLDVRHRLFVTFASRGGIQVHGATAALGRLFSEGSEGEPGSQPAVSRDRLRDALSGCLSTHLYQSEAHARPGAPGAVAGVREIPGSSRLSAAAGVGAALLARRLFPGDERLAELALRLADFALKGQHPSGLFHTAFDLRRGEWQGARGRSGECLLDLAEACRTADALLALSQDLAADGLPHEKYWLAGIRFVEFFIDSKARLVLPGNLHAPAERAAAEPGLGGMGLFSPLSRVYAKTRRDRHKKPLDDLARAFSSLPWDGFAPPSSRAGRDGDAEAALLAARLFVEMRQHGYRPVEPTGGTPAVQKKRAAEAVQLFASLLVPWIRLEPGQGGTGMLADSFVRQRLLPAGYETAWLLLSLRAQASEPALVNLLKRLALLCIESSEQVPMGTAWIRHTSWDSEKPPASGAGGKTGPATGPVDSRRLVREIDFGLRLLRDPG